MEHVILFSTAPNEKEAEKIAHALVEKHLAACVNIVPKIRSIYFWKDKVCDEAEVLLMMKAPDVNIEAIKSEIKSLHSYECPELIVLPISDGLPEYLKWIDESSIRF